MAIIYYPQSTTVNQRTVSGSAFTEVDLGVVPNVIFFFNTQSQLDYATGSVYPYTTSYCATASWALSSIPSPSSSWSDTSSWAINVINGGTTVVTASTYQITASQAISASWAPDLYPQTEQISASWASSSLSASYAQTASWVSNLYPQIEQMSASWASASLSSSYAQSASWAINSSASFLAETASSAPSSSNIIVNGGNAVGSDITIGTNDAYGMSLLTSGVSRLYISSSGPVGIGQPNVAGVDLMVGGAGYVMLTGATRRIVGNSPSSSVKIVGTPSLTNGARIELYGQNTTATSNGCNIGGGLLLLSKCTGSVLLGNAITPDNSTATYYLNLTGSNIGIGQNFANPQYTLHSKGHIVPSGSNNYDLGTTTEVWNNVYANGVTASLFGTASNTVSSSFADSASWAPIPIIPDSSSWASSSYSSSYAQTASISISASLSATTSFIAVENAHIRLAPFVNNAPYAPTSESVMIGFNGVGQFASQSRGTVMIGYGTGQYAHDAGPPGGNGGSVFIGYKAGIFARSARGAVLIGPGAGNGNAGNGGINTGLVAIGSSAGANTAEASNAVLIGPAAAGQGSNVTASNAVVIGSNAAQTSTNITSAVIIGGNACASTPTADSVVAIGFRTMQNCLSPSNCTVIGALAGTALGNSTHVAAFGNSAGSNAKTSSYALFLGSSTDAVNTASNVQKSVAIGYNTKLSSSNICIIGGTGADALKVGMGGITAPVNTLDVLGNISCSFVTASLYGTASWAMNVPHGVTRITNNYTVPATDTTVICLHTASITITLPTASVVGTLLNIKNGTSGSWNITVTGSEMIDDQTNVIINSPYSSMQLQSDGYQWWII